MTNAPDAAQGGTLLLPPPHADNTNPMSAQPGQRSATPPSELSASTSLAGGGDNTAGDRPGPQPPAPPPANMAQPQAAAATLVNPADAPAMAEILGVPQGTAISDALMLRRIEELSASQYPGLGKLLTILLKEVLTGMVRANDGLVLMQLAREKPESIEGILGFLEQGVKMDENGANRYDDAIRLFTGAVLNMSRGVPPPGVQQGPNQGPMLVLAPMAPQGVVPMQGMVGVPGPVPPPHPPPRPPQPPQGYGPPGMLQGGFQPQQGPMQEPMQVYLPLAEQPSRLAQQSLNIPAGGPGFPQQVPMQPLPPPRPPPGPPPQPAMANGDKQGRQGAKRGPDQRDASVIDAGMVEAEPNSKRQHQGHPQLQPQQQAGSEQGPGQLPTQTLFGAPPGRGPVPPPRPPPGPPPPGLAGGPQLGPAMPPPGGQQPTPMTRLTPTNNEVQAQQGLNAGAPLQQGLPSLLGGTSLQPNLPAIPPMDPSNPHMLTPDMLLQQASMGDAQALFLMSMMTQDPGMLQGMLPMGMGSLGPMAPVPRPQPPPGPPPPGLGLPAAPMIKQESAAASQQPASQQEGGVVKEEPMDVKHEPLSAEAAAAQAQSQPSPADVLAAMPPELQAALPPELLAALQANDTDAVTQLQMLIQQQSDLQAQALDAASQEGDAAAAAASTDALAQQQSLFAALGQSLGVRVKDEPGVAGTSDSGRPAPQREPASKGARSSKPIKIVMAADADADADTAGAPTQPQQAGAQDAGPSPEPASKGNRSKPPHPAVALLHRVAPTQGIKLQYHSQYAANPQRWEFRVTWGGREVGVAIAPTKAEAKAQAAIAACKELGFDWSQGGEGGESEAGPSGGAGSSDGPAELVRSAGFQDRPHLLASALDRLKQLCPGGYTKNHSVTHNNNNKA